jgi:hypothetical protein
LQFDRDLRRGRRRWLGDVDVVGVIVGNIDGLREREVLRLAGLHERQRRRRLHARR